MKIMMIVARTAPLTMTMTTILIMLMRIMMIMSMIMARYQSGPLDMMNLSEGRAPHEAVTRVKQLEAVSIIIIVIIVII